LPRQCRGRQRREKSSGVDDVAFRRRRRLLLLLLLRGLFGRDGGVSRPTTVLGAVVIVGRGVIVDRRGRSYGAGAGVGGSDGGFVAAPAGAAAPTSAATTTPSCPSDSDSSAAVAGRLPFFSTAPSLVGATGRTASAEDVSLLRLLLLLSVLFLGARSIFLFRLLFLLLLFGRSFRGSCLGRRAVASRVAALFRGVGLVGRAVVSGGGAFVGGGLE